MSKPSWIKAIMARVDMGTEHDGARVYTEPSIRETVEGLLLMTECDESPAAKTEVTVTASGKVWVDFHKAGRSVRIVVNQHDEVHFFAADLESRGVIAGPSERSRGGGGHVFTMRVAVGWINRILAWPEPTDNVAAADDFLEKMTV